MYASAFKRSQLMPADLGGLLWTHDYKDVDLPNLVKLNLVYNTVQNEYRLQQVKVWRLVVIVVVRIRIQVIAV